MTKIIKNRRSFKAPIILLAILIVALGLFAYRMNKDVADSAPIANGPSKVEIQEAAKINAEAKKQLAESPEISKADTRKSVAAPTGGKLEITAQKESNNTVTVFNKLFGYSEGSCELVVSNTGKTNTQNAQVIYQPEYSTCAGFSVPVDSVGVGTWTITLNVLSGGKTTTTSIKQEVR